MRRPVVIMLLLTAILLTAASASAEIRVVFNSQTPLSNEILQCFSQAVARAEKEGQGTIDVAIFSFTSRRLADTLLRIGHKFPDVKIRVLANLSMLDSDYSMIPYIENVISGDKEHYRAEAKRESSYIKDEEKRAYQEEKVYNELMSQFRGKPIPNIEVKYHYYPGWSWSDQEGGPAYDHFHQKSHIWHHKAVIVNGDLLATGSYNWSSSAEIKNLENIMIFSGPEEKHLVDDFLAEYNAMWNDPKLAASGEESRRRRDEQFQKIRRERAEQDVATP